MSGTKKGAPPKGGAKKPADNAKKPEASREEGGRGGTQIAAKAGKADGSPAEKPRPLPMMTMARAPSLAARCSPSSRPARTSVRSVLTGAFLIRSTWTSPSKPCSTNGCSAMASPSPI
jgi:hypothetical protein